LCWDTDPAVRPAFSEILTTLERMRAEFLAHKQQPCVSIVEVPTANGTGLGPAPAPAVSSPADAPAVITPNGADTTSASVPISDDVVLHDVVMNDNNANNHNNDNTNTNNNTHTDGHRVAMDISRNVPSGPIGMLITPPTSNDLQQQQKQQQQPQQEQQQQQNISGNEVPYATTEEKPLPEMIVGSTHPHLMESNALT
jgi:hypothetical protein